MTDLLNAHWATPLSAVEGARCRHCTATSSRPCGFSGFDAAAAATLYPVGPAPDGQDEAYLMPLIEHFNRERHGSTHPTVLSTLLVTDHYRPLVQRTWDLVWRCKDLDVTHAEARSVPRRWRVDREAYARNVDCFAHNGRRRMRQTPVGPRCSSGTSEARRLLEA
jgi:hypothetical protein